MGNIIKYKDWKTGKELEYELSTSYPAENKTKINCPFDNTPLIRWYDPLDKGVKCINCGIEYGNVSLIQEKVNDLAKRFIEESKKIY